MLRRFFSKVRYSDVVKAKETLSEILFKNPNVVSVAPQADQHGFFINVGMEKAQTTSSGAIPSEYIHISETGEKHHIRIKTEIEGEIIANNSLGKRM